MNVDARTPGMPEVQHPEWEDTCEQLDSDDIVHRGRIQVFATALGIIAVHRVRCDDCDVDGRQSVGPVEVRIERLDQPRGPRYPGDGYDPGAEHHSGDEVEALATLAEAQDDEEGRALAALLRDLRRDDA